jgi:hypothetical protein
MRTTRSRGLVLVAAIAVTATLFVAAPAPADPISCSLAQGFKWCDVHWRWADLPVAVYANTSSLPVGVSGAQLTQAVQGAVEAWELPATIVPLTPTSGDCPAGTKVLCYKGTISSGKAVDGKTVVMFGSTAGSSIGETRWCFAGSGCPASGTQLKDADVILEASGVSWHQATPAEVVVGELGGPFGPYRCSVITCPGWYDLQSIVTHELGHVLGLDEAEGFFTGCGSTSSGEWAADLTDVVNFMQTMYPCQWKGLTNRRTIDVGDLAGLVVAFLGSRLDS